TRRRVSTQPDSPLLVRIRLQSSVDTGLGAAACGSSLPSCSSSRSSARSVFESSSQFEGGAGGFGRGIGGYFPSFGAAFFSSVLGFLGGGGMSGLRTRSTRGVLVCMRTSTLSFSLTCRKLGDWREGCV